MGAVQPVSAASPPVITEGGSVFRGISKNGTPLAFALTLLGGKVPLHNAEVVAAFCQRASLEVAPFEAVDRLKRGGPAGGDPKDLFSGYYEQLSRAVEKIDRFGILGGESR